MAHIRTGIVITRGRSPEYAIINFDEQGTIVDWTLQIDRSTVLNPEIAFHLLEQERELRNCKTITAQSIVRVTAAQAA